MDSDWTSHTSLYSLPIKTLYLDLKQYCKYWKSLLSKHKAGEYTRTHTAADFKHYCRLKVLSFMTKDAPYKTRYMVYNARTTRVAHDPDVQPSRNVSCATPLDSLTNLTTSTAVK